MYSDFGKPAAYWGDKVYVRGVLMGYLGLSLSQLNVDMTVPAKGSINMSIRGPCSS